MSEFNNASLLTLIDYTRRKALEEAAKVCESFENDDLDCDAIKIAAAIRALTLDD